MIRENNLSLLTNELYLDLSDMFLKMTNIKKIPEYEGPEKILSPSVKRFDSISVVGNSGKLEGSKKGEDIDKKEAVIRMNAAPTEGYERDVGSKETFRFINGLLQKGKSLSYIDTQRNWLKTLENKNLILMPLGKIPREKAEKMAGRKNTIHTFNQPFKKYITEDIKKVIGKTLSTGVISTLLSKHISKEVHLYGFGFHQEKLKNRHYYENWNDSNDQSHNWLKEKKFLKKLEQKNKSIHIC